MKHLWTWIRGVNAMRCVAMVAPALIVSGCVASMTTEAASEEVESTQSALESAAYAQTRYPIVLCHGMGGFKALFGVIDYFHGIESTLLDAGAEVYFTHVPPLDSTEARGEVLLAQVEDIVARTGYEKVNLIGHSHGGLDVRYVAAVRPDLVASVTTIGSPHLGAELATYLRSRLQEGQLSTSVVSFFANSFGVLLSLLSGHPSLQDSSAALESLTFEGAELFNASYPAGLPTSWCGEGAAEENGVRYYSWSGTGILTSALDPSDLSLKLSSSVYAEPSDGLVGACSAHLGQVIRDDYRMNHLDQVNQLFGFTALFGPNPKSVFRLHANRLQNDGL